MSTMLKRGKRDENLDDVRKKIKARDALNAKMESLASERRELGDILHAVETYVPPPTRPKTGPGSRGGPGARITQSLAPSNIIDSRRR